MPNFIINNTSTSLSSDWVDAEKFNSKGRIVDIKGNAVDSRRVDCQYRLTGKKEKAYNLLERIGRAVLGILYVLGSGGFALRSSSVQKLFTKEKKSIRFGELIPSPKKEPDEKKASKRQLAKGMPKKAFFKRQIEAYEKGSISPDKIYTCRDGHTVFTLSSAPGYIFKKQEDAEQRYESMLLAQTVCRTHQLGLLKIPHARLIGKYIVEEKLELENASIQEENFKKYASSINETIRQLAVFICKTGFSDVSWRNNPVLSNSGDLKKIALIDLEELNPSEEFAGIGLFGVPSEKGISIPTRRGLIGCVNENQGNIIRKVADKELPSYAFMFNESYQRRKNELEEERKLEQFYEKRGIKTGKELIPIDSLGEEEKLVAAIVNELIQKSNGEDSKKRKRHFILNGKYIQAVQSLVDKGVLFKMERYEGNLIIQA